jgi:hypothetical protein
VFDCSWKFTGFYGHPEVHKRKESWDLLRHLATLSPLSWLCMGNFNEIIDDAEKWGEARRARAQMTAFQSTLETCRLADMGFSVMFTLSFLFISLILY